MITRQPGLPGYPVPPAHQGEAVGIAGVGLHVRTPSSSLESDASRTC